jgi:hypothetical protein
MIRTLTIIGVLLAAVPAWSSELVDRMARTMMVEDVTRILREEGVADGRALDDSFLDGQGGAFWEDQIGSIYVPGRIAGVLKQAFADTMTDADIRATTEFYASYPGRKILALENSARQAMSDPDILEHAIEAAKLLEDSGAKIWPQIVEYVDMNDLIDLNVSSTLNASVRFYEGMMQGGVAHLSEGEILETVWRDRESTVRSTQDWVYAFLAMAYKPLSDEEMRAYLDFSRSEAGQALNRALFFGFDTAYREISFDLGQAIAQFLYSSEL